MSNTATNTTLFKQYEKNIGRVLLPDNKDFLITRIGSNYISDRTINVTYRAPVFSDESTISVSTTSISVDKLKSLRVTEFDGRTYITVDDGHRMCVINLEVGYRIIQGIRDEFRPIKADVFVEKYAGLIVGLFCAVGFLAVCVSASKWLISHSN